MATKELSTLVAETDVTSPLMALILKTRLLAITEDSELERMHSFLADVVSGDKLIEEAEELYGMDACKLLTKDQADRLVFDWLNENGLDIGQSVSNLLSENRRIPLTDSSLSKAQIKGNRHKYGACPYSEGRPLSYFKAVLLRWLEENVRPEAKVVGLSS